MFIAFLEGQSSPYSRVLERKLDRLSTLPETEVVMLAVFVGLRKAEIAGLEWRDVNEGSILVSRSVVRGIEGPAKTPWSEVAVPIGPRVQQALADWKKRTRFSGPEEYVFSIRTPQPIQMDMVLQKVLKPAARKMGVEPLAWHDLRHTFCTLGRRAGVQPEVMQRLMRHTNIRTTLEILLARHRRWSSSSHRRLVVVTRCCYPSSGG